MGKIESLVHFKNVFFQNEIRNGRHIRRLTLGQPQNPYMDMNSRSRENSMSMAGAVNSKSQSSEPVPTSRGSTRLERPNND